MRFLKPYALLLLTVNFLLAETDFRFAFPQSDMLLGVDVKWMLKSPFAQTLQREAKSNLGELAAFDSLLTQVDSVYLSAVSRNGKNTDVLLLVQGRFDLDELLSLGLKNGLRLEKWGKTRVLVQPKSARPSAGKAAFQKAQFSLDPTSAKPFFALLDNSRIVIGEEAPLRVALERIETGLEPKANPLFDRARDLEAANDLWLVGNTAPLNLEAAAKTNAPMAKYASQIRNFSLGLSARQHVSLDLQLQAASPKIANEILDLAKGAIALAKMQSGSSPEPLPVDIDRVLQLSASGSLVKASLAIEQADIDKLLASGILETFSSAPAQPNPAVTASQPPAEAPKAVEPARKTVMIYGLPGGPKEIPVP
jgi:hypothetical protein